MSRARGPHSPIVETSSVRSVRVVGRRRAGGRRTTCGRPCPCAPPVTTRKWSSPSRITVRSERKPPCGVEHRACRSPCRPRRRTGRRRSAARVSSAPGPSMSKIWNARQVDDAGGLAHPQVLGVDDRAPPARVPLVLARHHRVAVLLERGRRWTRTSAAAPSRRSRRRPRRASAADSCIGESRWSRSDSYCSAGWMMP